MENFYGRCVFFVNDAERSLAYYTSQLGFSVDWNYQEEGKAFVFQISLFGFELIINQIGPLTEGRAGHGRVFVGLDPDQMIAFYKHVGEHGIATTTVDWGNPTIVIRDLDENELYFTPPRDKGGS